MSDALQIMLDALGVGGLYALTAIGIGLIFSVMRLINFAHSELITTAAYVLFLFYTQSIGLAILGAIAFAAGLAVLTERVAFRPLRHADQTTLLVSSFAVSMFIQKLLIFAVGSRPKGMDFLPGLSRELEFGGVRLQLLQIVTILVCAGLLGALTLFLRRTRFGIQMLAAAENFRMARLLGVRANQIIMVAFAISGFLAAIVAVLFTAQTGLVQPRVGIPLVMIAFVGTVIGGLGSLFGAAVGGFLVGCGSTILQALLPRDLGVFREAFVFLLVILILLIRPRGLFPGRGMKERV